MIYFYLAHFFQTVGIAQRIYKYYAKNMKVIQENVKYKTCLLAAEI